MLIKKELILMTARKIACDLGHTFIGIAHFNTALAALTNSYTYIKCYNNLLHTIGRGTPISYNNKSLEMDSELELAYLSYPNIVRI